MANFDSDYEIRLATLQALGGDTTRHYDSVYSIDLEILSIIEHGGGGEGMDYNQIKAALAASGVTEILFIGNGSGETVTLDYEKIKQIEPFDYAKVQSGLTNTGVTDILVKDGSGNTIDMNYELLNQIEPFDYAKVQSGLTNTGVSTIKVNGTGSNTKTIDYDAVNHIPDKYIVVMTEAEYEALTTKDENTIYFLTSN